MSTSKTVFLENKKFIKILEATRNFLANTDVVDKGISIRNKMMPKSEGIIQYTDFTGKGFEDIIYKSLNYCTYKEAIKNNLEYFFQAISEPLGGNEFPDFRVMVGKINLNTKKIIETYEFYLENKTYSSHYNFGTSSVEALLDNILTKIGMPTKIQGTLKKVDKLTCPILIEKFLYDAIEGGERQYRVSDIEIFQLYEVVGFNKTGGFTTKNGEKNQMVVPVHNSECTLVGSVDDWIRCLIDGIKEDKNSIMRGALCRLEIPKEKAIKILEDRLLHPYLYQHSRDLGKEIANSVLF